MARGLTCAYVLAIPLTCGYAERGGSRPGWGPGVRRAWLGLGRRPPATRLQVACSAPVWPVRSSVWPKSHTSSGAMSRRQRGHRMVPVATAGSSSRRAC